MHSSSMELCKKSGSSSDITMSLLSIQIRAQQQIFQTQVFGTNAIQIQTVMTIQLPIGQAHSIVPLQIFYTMPSTTMFTSHWITTKMLITNHQHRIFSMIMCITSQIFFSMHLNYVESDSSVMTSTPSTPIPASIPDKIMVAHTQLTHLLETQ